jgi:hypothetical protein
MGCTISSEKGIFISYSLGWLTNLGKEDYMEFRIKNHQAFVNGGKLQTQWWTAQKLFGVVWFTARKAVPYNLFNEVIRFSSVDKAKDYVEEQLNKTRKFKVVSEVI